MPLTTLKVLREGSGTTSTAAQQLDKVTEMELWKGLEGQDCVYKYMPFPRDTRGLRDSE